MPHQIYLVNIVVNKIRVALVRLFIHILRRWIPLHSFHFLIGIDQVTESAGDPVARRHQDSHVLHLSDFATRLEFVDLSLGIHRGRIAPLVVAEHVPGSALLKGRQDLLTDLDASRVPVSR